MPHLKLHAFVATILFLFAANYYAFSTGTKDSTEATTTVKAALSFKADIVSRYVWRGKMLDAHPQFQPQLELSAGNFIAGAWGSQSLTTPYGEVDLFISYAVGNVSVTVFDYFYMDEKHLEQSRFFNYQLRDSIPSCHTLDATLEWKGIKGSGFSMIASVFFFGDDHNIDQKRRYTNYLGIDYHTAFSDIDLVLSLGGSLSEGFYSNKAALTNIALKALRFVPFHTDHGINLSGTITFNPNDQNLFFTLGLGI